MLGVSQPECNGPPRPTAAVFLITADSQPGKFEEISEQLDQLMNPTGD